MKYLNIIFAFCLSFSATAQLIKIEPMELPLSLSLLEYPNYQNRFNGIIDLKKTPKPYTFTSYELNKMRNKRFFIDPKTQNKNYTFIESSRIYLKKELRKVMLKIPGEFGPISPKGFTL